jgi:hypothetical protein
MRSRRLHANFQTACMEHTIGTWYEAFKQETVPWKNFFSHGCVFNLEIYKTSIEEFHLQSEAGTHDRQDRVTRDEML